MRENVLLPAENAGAGRFCFIKKFLTSVELKEGNIIYTISKIRKGGKVYESVHG